MVRTIGQTELYTAKDIAEAIAFRKDPNGFSKALRQVKHWTNSGLLKTFTKVGTGTGISREYLDVDYEPTILIAAVLQELTLFGLTVETMKPIAARLYRDADEGDPDDVFTASMTDEFKGYLALEFDVSSKGLLRLADIRTFSVGAMESEPVESNLPKARSTILIDLGAVTSRIKWPVYGEGSAA